MEFSILDNSLESKLIHLTINQIIWFDPYIRGTVHVNLPIYSMYVCIYVWRFWWSKRFFLIEKKKSLFLTSPTQIIQ